MRISPAQGSKRYGHGGLPRQSLSGFFQNFYHLVRIAKRVHRRVGEILSAYHGERKAAQVNSSVGKLLSHLRGDARPILAHDSNGMEGKRNVKTHLCGRSDFPVTPQRRDEHDSCTVFERFWRLLRWLCEVKRSGTEHSQRKQISIAFPSRAARREQPFRPCAPDFRRAPARDMCPGGWPR